VALEIRGSPVSPASGTDPVARGCGNALTILRDVPSCLAWAGRPRLDVAPALMAVALARSREGCPSWAPMAWPGSTPAIESGR